MSTLLVHALVCASILAVSTRPTYGSCAPIQAPLSTRVDSTNYSWIYQAGWGPTYGGGSYPPNLPYDAFPAVDRTTLFGVFWAIGSGNPDTTMGDDNGTFPVNDWIESRDYPTSLYYAAEIPPTVGWGSDARINGCVLDSATAGGCTCVLLTQNNPDTGGPQFTLLSARADGAQEIYFNLPANDPIVLSSIPTPVILSSVRDQVTLDVTLEVTVPAPSQGIYQQDGCDCDLKFLVKQIIWPRELPGAPDSHDVEDWTDLEGSAPTAFGATDEVISRCGAFSSEVWLATQLVADSGFATPIVSDVHPAFVECGEGECPTPDQPELVTDVSLIDDGMNHPIFSFQDFNDPAAVTGFNVYRSDEARLDPAIWPQVASNIQDMDAGLPDNQWTDASGDVSPTGIWFYQITAYTSVCLAEGPR